jgi:hypothetical protein
MGQRGIPQGSAVSPFVAEHLLSDLLLTLPGEARAVMYVDNIWVFVRTRREAERIKELLRAAAERHRAGPLRLKPIEIRRVADWFKIFHYRMRMRYGKIEIEPIPAKLRAEFDYCYVLTYLGKDLDHVEAHIKSWTASFGLWPAAAKFRDLMLADVAAARERMARP